MSYQKRLFSFTMLLFSICILLYGLNVKLTAIAYPTDKVLKSSLSSFEFVEEYEYKIMEVRGVSEDNNMKLQREGIYSSYEIDSYKDINTNELIIDCMEAIDMRHLLDGNSALRIDYKGKYTGAALKDNEILGLEEEMLDEFIKIGVISFQAVNKEPYFRVSNKEASIGIGTKNFLIPSKAYELIPTEISDFNVYSNIIHINNNAIEGTIIIKRQEISGSLVDKISLKDLNLSENLVRSINGGNIEYSTLEIVKNYVFNIPLESIIKDEKFIFEYREEGYDTYIKVELPLRFQARVIHN